MSGITVIYDGNCQLCINSINWLTKKLSFDAISYQSAPLAKYGLSLAECEKQVYAISGDKKYGGVTAVIFLLKLSGPIGALGYKMIATNRQSIIVKGLSRFIKKIT